MYNNKNLFSSLLRLKLFQAYSNIDFCIHSIFINILSNMYIIYTLYILKQYLHKYIYLFDICIALIQTYKL